MAFAMSAAFGCSRMQSAQNLIEARKTIYDDVESEGFANAVVVIRKPLLGKSSMVSRNDPAHEQSVLYVTITDKLQVALLQARFPERNFYVYDVRKQPTLHRLSSKLRQ